MATFKSAARRFTDDFNLPPARGEGIVSEAELERAKLKNRAIRAPVLAHVAGLDANVEKLLK